MAITFICPACSAPIENSNINITTDLAKCTNSQLGIYFILDQTNKKHGKTILFILVLMAHFFVFPPYYYPQPVPGGTNCGMPLLGIMLVFWLIGGGITVIIHVGYHLSKFVQKSRLNNKPAPENPQTH